MPYAPNVQCFRGSQARKWNPEVADTTGIMAGKLAFFAFLLVGTIAAFVAYQAWGKAPRLNDKDMAARQGEYQAALDESHRTGKPLILDFYADWCGPCRWMHENTWSDPRVVRAMRNFVFVPVNVDNNGELSHMFGVEGIPHVVLISPNGKIIGSQTGAVPPDRLLSWLPQVNREIPSAQ